MVTNLSKFEAVARRAYKFSDSAPSHGATLHPFDNRNIYSNFPPVIKELFDDGHFAQATFEAYKFLDKEVQRHSKSSESGFKLMMQVFAGTPPGISLNSLSSTTDQDEQKGVQFLCAGCMLAIRNPRGHEYAVKDDPDQCLDHLTLASMILRRLAEAGYK